ncbi:hypothetical protein HYU50_05580 [Candidatus Woesearchaeota archaeon]|nr:hypothetical protein [Candidatus Woesearchaeota archaeon]
MQQVITNPEKLETAIQTSLEIFSKRKTCRDSIEDYFEDILNGIQLAIRYDKKGKLIFNLWGGQFSVTDIYGEAKVRIDHTPKDCEPGVYLSESIDALATAFGNNT